VPVSGFIGEAANSVGGYVAEALPSGLNAYEMFAQPRKAYACWVLNRNWIATIPNWPWLRSNRRRWWSSMTPFKHQAALDYADVLLPISPFTETSGTFVNTEGRVQSFSGSGAAARRYTPWLEGIARIRKCPGLAEWFRLRIERADSRMKSSNRGRVCSWS
jgi:hypothetical protein